MRLAGSALGGTRGRWADAGPRRPWLLPAAVGSLALYAALLALSWDRLAAILPYHIPAAVALVLLVRTVPKCSGRERLGLVALGGMVAFWDLGDWVFSVSQARSGSDPDFPSLAEPLYYAGYLFAIVAVPLLSLPAAQLRDRRWLFDVGIVVVVLGAIGWQYLVLPRTDAMAFDGWKAALAFGYPLLDVGILMSLASTFYLAGGRLSPRGTVLLVALTVFVVTDGLYTASLVNGTSKGLSNWLDMGWLTVNWLIAFSVTRPGATGADANAIADGVRRLGIGDVIAYALALPLIVVAVTRPGDVSAPVIEVGGIAVVLLVFARQVLSSRENQGLTERLREEGRQQAALAHALRDSENLGRTIIESAGEGLVVYDRGLRHVLFNPAMERITGFSSAEVAGKTIAEVLPALARQGVGALVEAAIDGATVSQPDAPFQIAGSGRSGILAGHYSPLRSASGEVVGAVGVLQDVAEERRTEQVLGQAQKMESLGVLAGGVAHDFNNLLTTILGSCSLLKQESGLGGADRQTVDLIEEAARRGATISGRLLSFARGGLTAFVAIDLRDVVADVVALARPSFRDQVRLDLELPPEPALVEGDRGQLEQVLLNLLLNARDALSGGGLVTARLCVEGADAVLTVADDGPGMGEATRLRVFEPFFTTKPVGSGTGLGLSIAYGIVQHHHGSIAVASAPAEGAIFTVRLPLKAEKHGRNGAGGDRRWVLTVDDDELIRRTL